MPAREKRYPSEALRIQLLRELGLARSDQEHIKLRSLLYKAGMPPPVGSNTDDLARLLLALHSKA